MSQTLSDEGLTCDIKGTLRVNQEDFHRVWAAAALAGMTLEAYVWTAGIEKATTVATFSMLGEYQEASHE